MALRRLAPLALLAALGCAPMIFGAHGRREPSHFLVVLHNADVVSETVTAAWWDASTVVGSASLVVPALGDRTFDLGPAHPDGLQLVATAWNGLPGGPGGLVFQTPDYASGWIFDVTYPTGYASVRR